MFGHRRMLDPELVKSRTGHNPDAWPLRVNLPAASGAPLPAPCTTVPGVEAVRNKGAR